MSETHISSKQQQKFKAVEATILKLRNSEGADVVRSMMDAPAKVYALPTGCRQLDIATGVGGIGRGRVVEIFGPQGSGKTTLVYHIMAEAQGAGGGVVFIDAEKSMDWDYARRIGVKKKDFTLSQLTDVEDALKVVVEQVESGKVRLIAVDSVAALVPPQGGSLARTMSRFMRRIALPCSKNNTTVVFTNQIREKMGVTDGSNEMLPGGRALKYLASQRFDVRRIGDIKDPARNGEVIGQRCKIKVVKNKIGTPFGVAEADLMYGSGFVY